MSCTIRSAPDRRVCRERTSVSSPASPFRPLGASGGRVRTLRRHRCVQRLAGDPRARAGVGATDVIVPSAGDGDGHRGKVQAIAHAVTLEPSRGQFRTCVDLDATSPMRHDSDLVAALRYSRLRASLITGTEARRNPYFNLVEHRARHRRGVKTPTGTCLRRQDAPRSFDMNGSIYIWRATH